MDLLFKIIKNFILKDKFNNIEINDLPFDTVASIILFCMYSSILLTVFCNYYAFYYLVKDHFDLRYSLDKRTSRNTDISLQDKNEKNCVVSKEINDFLN